MTCQHGLETSPELNCGRWMCPTEVVPEDSSTGMVRLTAFYYFPCILSKFSAQGSSSQCRGRAGSKVFRDFHQEQKWDE